ncbi:MAG: radical SAM protein [Candidatus Omnitrophica bacterium]|nr:radical SAM protein [Candidatus Omnitrophota bacterium]
MKNSAQIETSRFPSKLTRGKREAVLANLKKFSVDVGAPRIHQVKHHGGLGRFSFPWAAHEFFPFSCGERVSLINLGCARNLVDSEMILGALKERGIAIVNIENADTVIVNTCAFVADAKEETIDTLLALINLKKQKEIKTIIAMGCFTQRYAKIFKKEFPEVDKVFGILPLIKDKNFARAPLTPDAYAYLKICESCYNHCSFCAIPSIKGKFSSRLMENVVEEAKSLEARGAREINIIGQDITAYGLDIYGQMALPRLLKNILKATKKVRWIRLLYAFPRHISDELLDVIASEPRICKYIDLPLQHINDRILTSMNRGFSRRQALDLIEKIRTKIHQCSLRTAFIVGYPGETEKEFRELCQFVKDFTF